MTYPADATPNVVLYQLQGAAFVAIGQNTPVSGAYSFPDVDPGSYRVGFYDDRDEPVYLTQFFNGVVTDDPDDPAIQTLAIATAPITGVNGGVALLTLTDVPTPRIVGDKVVGGEISADLNGWESDDVAIAYGWIRNGKELAVDDDYYDLTPKDLGASFALKIYTQADGYAEVTRTTGEFIVGPGQLVPGKVKITGVASVGKNLKAVTGKWKPGKSTFTYQWLANGKVIKKATKVTFKPTSAQVGKKISVKVTGTQTGYKTVVVKSGKTKKVK